MQRFEDTAQVAENEITAYENARAVYADKAREEMRLEAERPIVKYAAVTRIMNSENPLTHKQHSASSAEAIVETDEEYRAHLLNQRNTVHAKNRAWTDAESAFFRANLALAQLKAVARVA